MKTKLFILFILSIAVLQFSCKKFLNIDTPKESLVQETVFASNEIATSTVTGIYSQMGKSGYASGGNSSITAICGVSADELKAYNILLKEFYEAQLNANNSTLTGLYASPYISIYTANAVLEGLASADKVTPEVKKQLKGEVLFIRAFAYFYLVNLFGPVPLQLTTDYRVTRIAKRSSVNEVYQQILEDLKTSESLLTENYISTERIRPNLSTVQAMLARTYLFQKDWANAEKYASLIIAKTGTYQLVGLDEVFLKNSKETIWQLMPVANTNSLDGNLFILTGTPSFVSLESRFSTDVFESGDKRKTAWIKTFNNSSGLYYYPSKYKVKSSTVVSEYSMVFRLAEQYLIRAEARINLGNVEAGVRDLNIIRLRPLANGTNANTLAALPLTMSKSDALRAIEKERKIELFSEWGHRWLDLKRWGQASTILSPIKINWQNTDVLYPIPDAETSRNLNINQNEGY